jgi:hypothetical protein
MFGTVISFQMALFYLSNLHILETTTSARSEAFHVLKNPSCSFDCRPIGNI